MRFLRKKWLKRILYSLLLILGVLIIWYFNLIVYGINQGIGQMRIVWNAKSFENFLAEGNYPDSVKVFYKKKLDLIAEVRRFAIDSLGLKNTKNYTKIYDQQNKPILWAVTASEPYELKPKEWDYGPLGKMPYKGYFDSTKAYNLFYELKKSGYDVSIYEPGGWSTLGWFSDPVLSSMLYWSEGSLAGLIIHEMTHSTIWINGKVEYNENLADFVGDNGALLFLEAKYGKKSKEYLRYINGDKDSQKFYQHILRGSEKLDSLYKTFRETDKKTKKDKLKTDLISEIIQKLDTLSFANKKSFGKRFKKELPNNAYFMSFRRYRGQQNQFETEFKTKFKSNFKQYLAYLKKEYAL